MKALIIGSDGQDGILLKQQLEAKNYEVWGLGKRSQAISRNYISFDLINGDYKLLESFIVREKPSEIYYVAAFHQSSQDDRATDLDFIERSVKVNQTGFINVLEICRSHHPSARIFYTSSSLIFSGAAEPIQDEKTAPAPRCIYSVTKCAAMHAADYYRNFYGLFVSVGIMYNHESALRKEAFLSKKIVNETRLIAEKKIGKITIGDLSAVTDWGYAPDYTKAMWHILQLPKPDVYIISSGTGHKVEDWFDTLSRHLGLDWKKFVIEDRSLITRKKPVLIGDNSKLLSTGWQPKVSFEDMVIRMYNNTI